THQFFCKLHLRNKHPKDYFYELFLNSYYFHFV
ncbi:hypothetical protein EAY45_22340, partial [Vibrio anguillarum]|nr:hypothetical protein [Vibrio anguillarum]